MNLCRYCNAEFEAPKHHGFDAQYCPNCGKLLPGKSEVIVVDKDWLDVLKDSKTPKPPFGKIYVDREEATRKMAAYNKMIKSGHAPAGKILVKEDEYLQLKTTTLLLDEWKKERDRLRKTPQYQDVEHFTWGFYLGTTLMSAFMIAGLVCLFFVIIPFAVRHLNLNKGSKDLIEIVKDDATGKYGIYDNKRDSLIVPYEYDSIFHRKGYYKQKYHFNVIFLRNNGKYGVADSLGRITVSCELDSVRGNYDGLMIMYNEEKRGVLDYLGNPVVPCNHQYVLWDTPPRNDAYNAGTYVGNIIPVKTDNNSEWELYNRKGKRICDKKYHKAIQTGDPKLIKVCERLRVRNSYEEKYGVVDENGQEVIPCKYYGISSFSNERAWAQEKDGGAWSLMTANGELLKTLPLGYWPFVFSEGLAAVKNGTNQKIGYYDTEGNLAIHFRYKIISPVSPSFSGNKARVSLDGVSGSIDKHGVFTPDRQPVGR